MRPDETIQYWTSRANVVRVKNAVNTLLWMTALVTPTSWLAAYFFQSDAILKYGFSLFGALPVFAALFAYFYFMLKDPDRLQSEEFVLRQQELSIYRSSDGAPKPIETEERMLPNIAEIDPREVMNEGEPS